MDDVHASSPAQFQQNPEKRRRRPPLACVACRRRKVRCDRKMPCQNCVRARRATSCAYVPDDRLEPREGTHGFHDHDHGININRRSPQSSDVVGVPTRTSSSYLSPAATNTGTTPTVTTTATTTATASHGSSQHGDGPVPVPETGGQDVAAALADRVRQLEQQLQQVLDSKKSGTAGSKPAPPTASQFMGEGHWPMADGTQATHYMKTKPWEDGGTQVMLAKSRYLGSSHWMHGVTLVRYVIHLPFSSLSHVLHVFQLHVWFRESANVLSSVLMGCERPW